MRKRAHTPSARSSRPIVRQWFALLALPLGFWLGNANADLSDRTWRLFQSQNFNIYSDLRPRQVSQTITDLETFHAGVHYLTGTDPADTPAHETRLFLFRRASDLRKVQSDPQVLGFMVPGLRYNLMAAAKPPRDSILNSRSAVVFHEYVHQLVRSVSSFRYPAWYDEGFAELLSTAHKSRNTIIFGRAPRSALQILNASQNLPLLEVLQYRTNANDAPSRQQRFYATAWLLTHYLLFSDAAAERDYPSAVRAYLQAFDRGEANPGTFEELIGTTLERLEHALKDYLDEIESFPVPISALNVNPQHRVRELSRDEARYELGTMLLAHDADQAAVLFESIPPTSALYARALSGLGEIDLRRGNHQAALQKQHRALELQPADYLLHLAMGDALQDTCVVTSSVGRCTNPQERESLLGHYAQAHNLARELAETNARYGQALLRQGRVRRALPLLQQAQRLAPASYSLLFDLGIAHLQLHQWEAAEYYLQRAKGWSVDVASAQQRVNALLAVLQRARDAERRALDDS